MQYQIPAGHGFFDIGQSTPAAISLTASAVLNVDGVTTTPFIPKRIAPLASTANIVLDGAFTGTAPSGVDFSWQGAGFVSGTSFQLNWNGAGTWRATFAGLARGDGTLIVRESNNTAVTASARLSVGDPGGGWGDSRMFSHAGPGWVTSSVPAYIWFGTAWLDTRNVGWTGYQWRHFIEQLRAFKGGPVFFIGGWVSGSHLTSDWAPGGTSYNDFLAMIAASGIDALSFLVAMCGVNDLQPPGSGGSPSAATLIAAFEATADGFKAAIAGSPQSFLDITAVRDYTPWGSGAADPLYIAAFNALRSATIDAATLDSSSVAVGGNLTGQDYSDHMHPDTDAQVIDIGQKFWIAVKASLYGGTNPARGPRLTSAQYTADQRTVYCDFDQTLSNAGGSTIVGISISATGSTPSITAATKTGARRVTLTLSAPFSGILSVRFAYAVDAAPGTDTINTSTLPFGPTITLDEQTHNTTIALPAEPQFGLTASLYVTAPMTPASIGQPTLAAYRTVVMV